MKLSNRRRGTTQQDNSMTSMIDVVFLLLIFFIVTTTFVRPEREIVSTIKVNEEQSEEDISDLEPAIVDVVRQDSQVIFRIGALRTNDLEEVKKLLNGFDNKSDGAFVRVADDVPYEAAAQAIGACKASGFESVSYLSLN
jgi:biopolymer transport protein ExbD